MDGKEAIFLNSRKRKALRGLGKVLFVLYIGFLIYLAILGPLLLIVGNVIIFIPFGFFLPMASKYRSCFATLFWSFGLSLCVEIFQLLTKVGSFDVDDILLNTIGGVAGHIIFVICVAIRRRHVRKR